MSDGLIQVRVRSVVWVATAVVLSVACTLVVTDAWSVGAASGDDDSTFVPTDGCRLVDTRPAPNTVGPRNVPLGPDDVFEVTVHGSNGECTGGLAVPSDAVAVALNVTATNATSPSDIRLYPANLTDVPLLSNLNVTAGAPPTPNKVDVKLSPDGKIRVYNFEGSVNVILDVVGYYTDSTLQELSAGLAAANSRIAALEATTASNDAAIAQLDLNQPFVVESLVTGVITFPVLSADVTALSVTVTAPTDGQVTVMASSSVFDLGDPLVRCKITTETVLDESASYIMLTDTGGLVDRANISGTRVFDLAQGQTETYNLICDSNETATQLIGTTMTAIFTPSS